MKKRILCLAMCLAMLFCVVSFSACGNTYESMAENYINALVTGDGEDVYDAMNFDAILEILVEEGEVDDDEAEEIKDYFVDLMDQLCEATQDALEDEYGDDYGFSVEIMRSKEMKNSELNDYEDFFGEDAEVEEGYIVKYKIIIDDESEKDELTVIKVNGEWIIFTSYLN